jgi:hypothetical protein
VFRVSDLGFGFWVLGFGVCGLGFGFWVLGLIFTHALVYIHLLHQAVLDLK